MSDKPEWIDTLDMAAAMTVELSRVRYACRSGLFPQYVHSSTGSGYRIDRGALNDKRWWTFITGTANYKYWGTGWTGPRMSRRQEAKLARNAIRAKSKA